jgi:hypothetical protein
MGGDPPGALANTTDPGQSALSTDMVRYMNAAGLKRKFDIEAYVSKWSNG